MRFLLLPALIFAISGAANADDSDSLLETHRNVVLSLLRGVKPSLPTRFESQDRVHSAKADAVFVLATSSLADRRLAELAPAQTRRLPVSCEQALPLALGDRLEFLSHDGASFWARVSSGEPTEISTFGSDVDTEVSVFDRCGGDAIASYDDNLGLAAIASVEAGDHFIRISQRGNGRVRLGTSSTVLLGGRVSGVGTGDDLDDGEVGLYSPSGQFFGQSDVRNSRYQFSVQAGEYLVAAGGILGHFAMVYQDISCGGLGGYWACENYLALADRVTVADENIGDIDFALTAEIHIAGRVVDQSGTGVRNVDVNVYPGGARVGETDIDGRFFVPVPEPDVMYAVALSSDEHLAELYDDVLCRESCLDKFEQGLGTLVMPSSTFHYDDLQVTLAEGSTLRIEVSGSAGASPAEQVVTVHFMDGSTIARTTDNSGAAVFTNMFPTEVRVTLEAAVFERTAYPDVTCPEGLCESASESITIDSSSQTVAMSARKRGVVKGNVNMPPGFEAEVGGVCWRSVESGEGQCVTAANGSYELDSIVENSYVYFYSTDLQHQLYPGIDCREQYASDCDFSEAHVFPAAIESVETNIDFNPTPRAALGVIMVDQTTGEAPSGRVCLFADTSMNYTDCRYSSNGDHVFQFVPPGNYWMTFESDGYPTVAYPDVFCSNSSCSEGFVEAQRISWDGLSDLETTWSVQSRPTVIAESVSGLLDTMIYAPELCIRYEETGDMECVHNNVAYPAPADIRIAVVERGYKARLVGGGDCPSESPDSCDWSKATVYSMDFGVQVAISEELSPSASLTIEYSENTLTPDVEFYTESGQYISNQTIIDERIILGKGRYKIVARGFRYHYTDGFGAYCLSSTECLNVAKTVIVDEDDHKVIVVEMKPSTGIFGRITGPTGEPLQNIDVDLWNAQQQFVATAKSDGDGVYHAQPSDEEPYFVSTSAPLDAFINEVFPDTSCPVGTSPFHGTCSLTDGVLVNAVAITPLSNEVDFQLATSQLAGRLFSDGFE